MTSAGLNGLRQKEYHISMKKWIFDDPFHKKGLVLVIWVLGMIQPSCWVNFLIKCGHWGQWGCWGHRGHWGCRGDKTWKITAEDFSVIQILKLSLTLMFWRRNKLGQNQEISCWILAPFLSEAVEASLRYFFENWLRKHKYPHLLNPLGIIIQ